MELLVRRLDPTLELPSYAHAGDAGLDLVARAGTVLPAGGGRALIPTGIAIAIPVGYAGFVQPRSGLAVKHGVTVLNSPGLIDCGYRDEVRVALVNLDPAEAYEVERGDRIAQLVVMAVDQAEWHEVDALPPASRGSGGFGSTGR
jgi:dUTP pyrophosphatase